MVRIPLLTFKVVKIDDEQIVVYIMETIDFKKGSRIDPVYHNKTTGKIKFLKWNNVSLLSESSWIQNNIYSNPEYTHSCIPVLPLFQDPAPALLASCC